VAEGGAAARAYLCTGGLRSFVDPISYMTICFDCCTLSRPIVEVIEKNLITNVFC
jgi:hypothetical protein